MATKLKPQDQFSIPEAERVAVMNNINRQTALVGLGMRLVMLNKEPHTGLLVPIKNIDKSKIN